jgi:hypothetical protein
LLVGGFVSLHHVEQSSALGLRVSTVISVVVFCVVIAQISATGTSPVEARQRQRSRASPCHAPTS